MFEKHRQERDQRHRERAAAAAAASQQRATAAAAANRNEVQRHVDELEDRLETVRNFAGVRAGDGTEIPIVLKRDEHMLCSIQGASLIEPRRGAGKWEGRSQGVSVRVPGTKSMRYRVGASRGQFVQGEERPTPIDIGTFTITDRRAVFTGTKQTREWLWAKLISVTHASDLPWTAISVSNRQKTSGVLYDKQHADIVHFWLDLGIARGTDGADSLIADLERAVREARASLGPAPVVQTIEASSVHADAPALTQVDQGDVGAATGDLTYVEGDHVADVVGESHYQDALETLCGGLSEEGHDIETIAELRPDPANPYDSNAVGVMIGGHLVGHLARDVAATVSPPLQRRTPAGISVRAWIAGGWDRGGGDTGMCGVRVLLPSPGNL